MKDNILLVASLVLLVLTLTPTGLLAQEGYEVHSLEFSGNKTISESQLISQMTTKKISGFQRTFLGKDAFLFSEEILQSDLKQIKRLYQQEGFLNIQIEISEHEINHKERNIKILIEITENTPIQINDVRFSTTKIADGSDPFDIKVISNMLGELKSQSQNRFRDSLLYQDQEVIVRKIEDIGFPYVKVEPNLSVDLEAHTVDIEWQLEPGPLCHFGDITVSGIKYASDRLVTKPLTFASGDIYSRLGWRSHNVASTAFPCFMLLR